MAVTSRRRLALGLQPVGGRGIFPVRQTEETKYQPILHTFAALSSARADMDTDISMVAGNSQHGSHADIKSLIPMDKHANYDGEISGL